MIQPIIISILFHHYKDLQEYVHQVERLQTKMNEDEEESKQGLTTASGAAASAAITTTTTAQQDLHLFF